MCSASWGSTRRNELFQKFLLFFQRLPLTSSQNERKITETEFSRSLDKKNGNDDEEKRARPLSLTFYVIAISKHEKRTKNEK